MSEWLRFDFQSIRQKYSPTKFRVVTDDFSNLMLFFRQHGFKDVPNESIQIVCIDDIDTCPDHYHILKPYKFKSNYSNEIYNIMTCEDFINYAIDSAANDLNGYLLFGEAILRHDIEIFKTIGELVYGLRHTTVFDYILADEQCVDNNDGLISREIAQMRKDYLTKVSAPCEDYGAYETFESLHNDFVYGEILPITLECYTSSFVEMMTDEYC